MRKEIETGETIELIPGQDEQSRRDYVAHVRKGEVSFSHSQQYARDGPRYRTGDEGHLKQLNNEPIYVYAHEEAVIEIDTDNFLFDLFGTRAVERPNDKAAKEQEVNGYIGDPLEIAAGATEIVVQHVNTGERAEQVAYATLATDEDNYGEVVGGVNVFDGEDTQQYAVAGHLPSFPLDFDPQLPLPPGWRVEMQATNNLGSPVRVKGATTTIR